MTTLGGGSLGSRVDEERSQLRELMWIAGHIEHRYLERTLRPRVSPGATPDWGSAEQQSPSIAAHWALGPRLNPIHVGPSVSRVGRCRGCWLFGLGRLKCRQHARLSTRKPSTPRSPVVRLPLVPVEQRGSSRETGANDTQREKWQKPKSRVSPPRSVECDRATRRKPSNEISTHTQKRNPTSVQTRPPAEFKHITKRRKRN